MEEIKIVPYPEEREIEVLKRVNAALEREIEQLQRSLKEAVGMIELEAEGTERVYEILGLSPDTSIENAIQRIQDMKDTLDNYVYYL